MKQLFLLSSLLLVVFVLACSETPVREQDFDVAYCVDSQNKVVEDKYCDQKDGTGQNNLLLYYWLFYPRSQPPLIIGQIAPAGGQRAARLNMPSARASTVPVVRSSSGAPIFRPAAPARPAAPVRPVSGGARPAPVSRPAPASRPAPVARPVPHR